MKRLSTPSLGNWDQQTGDFSRNSPSQLRFEDFRNFRDRHGVGGNFVVASHPHYLENFQTYSFYLSDI